MNETETAIKLADFIKSTKENEIEREYEIQKILERLIGLLPEEICESELLNYLKYPIPVGVSANKIVAEKQLLKMEKELKDKKTSLVSQVSKIVDWAKWDFWVHLLGDVLIVGVGFGVIQLFKG